MTFQIFSGLEKLVNAFMFVVKTVLRHPTIRFAFEGNNCNRERKKFGFKTCGVMHRVFTNKLPKNR